MGMENALGAPQADVDKFVMARARRSQAVSMGVENSATYPQRDVHQAVGASMNVSKQQKASVLQEHILDYLVTRHDFGRQDLTEWAQEVTLCGVDLEKKKGGPLRTKQT
jgi:hypothetical protein